MSSASLETLCKNAYYLIRLQLHELSLQLSSISNPDDQRKRFDSFIEYAETVIDRLNVLHQWADSKHGLPFISSLPLLKERLTRHSDLLLRYQIAYSTLSSTCPQLEPYPWISHVP
ncbi:hypothetical protein GEMRC1_002908 [Eukaryota sp. GEM-RC1]